VAPWESGPPAEGGLDTAFGDGRVDVYVVATQVRGLGGESGWRGVKCRGLPGDAG
jgi:hypothetical protein